PQCRRSDDLSPPAGAAAAAGPAGELMATAIVFDSGVGGLSVFDCIAAALPGLQLLYVADNAYFPYGTKEETAPVPRVGDLLAGLAERLRPDRVVMACNTASTIADAGDEGRLLLGAVRKIGIVGDVEELEAG